MSSTIPKNITPAYEPGLEVVQSEFHSDAGPQAALHASHNDKYSDEPVANHDDEGLRQYRDEGQESHVHSNKTGLTRKRKTWIAFAVGALILIIIAATVGGVVGSRGKSQDENPGSSNDTRPIPAAAMTGSGSPTSVAAGLAPTAVSWGGRHLEVFALTKDVTHSIYWKWRPKNATSDDDFEPRGLEMNVTGDAIDVDTTKTPSIALHARWKGQLQEDDRIDVQLTSRGGRLTQTWHWPSQRVRPVVNKPPWFPVKNLESTKLLSAPVMVRYPMESDMMTTVFLSDGSTNTSVWYIYSSSGDEWNPSTRIKGPDLHTWATPAAVAWSGDFSRLDIFAVSKDNNHLLHAFAEDEFSRWSEYEDLGGFVTTPPTVLSRTDGCLDVFARGGDGGLWHLSFENSRKWSDWRRISGATRIQGQPHAVSSSYKSVDVFAWGEDEGAMLYKTYDGLTGKWTPGDDDFTTLLPSGLAGPPKGIVVDKDVHVFAYDNQNQIVWQTIGPDKTAVGDARIWAKVPSNVF